MTSPDPRAAIVERREKIAAEPRPTQLSDDLSGIATPDLWRVYRHEWVIVYVTEDGEGATERVTNYVGDKLLGRVVADDYRTVVEGEGQYAVLQVQARLPNMRGEFKHREDAHAYVAEQGWLDATIVQRNSPADYELRAYGTKRLPK